MDHTYLRYECADAFGLTISSASSKAPQSNSILSFLGSNSSSSKTNSNIPSANPLLLTTAGSQCVGFNVRQSLPCLKLGHRERLSGGVGTGRALNSDEIVCIDTFTYTDNTSRVATGWIDGAVRIFELTSNESSCGNSSNSSHGLIHSLLQQNNEDEYGETSANEDEFVMREPLVLNGHSQTPVRSIAFDCSGDGTRVASGGSDGSVVVWDVIAETGLFRLLGHRGAITDIVFLRLGGGGTTKFDGLMTSSLDGLVKIWDLDGQCCTQTIANHRGEVWGAACMNIFSSKDQIQQQGSGDEEQESNERWRMITGSTDGQVRVWSVQQPKRTSTSESTSLSETNNDDQEDTRMIVEQGTADDNFNTISPSSMHEDDVCQYMGSLLPPPNVTTSTEKVSSIHFHPNGRYVGILHSNSKNVDIYQIRNLQESIKKKQRRLRRRREKKSQGKISTETNKKSGRKRGILDDPESSSDEKQEEASKAEIQLDPELMKASDEFEYYGTVRASHKLKGFTFVPFKERGAGIRVACALSTNAIEVHSIAKKKSSKNNAIVAVPEKVSGIEMYGHPTGIRSLTLSSDDVLACTVSKNVTKIWNVANRSCIMSVAPAISVSDKRGTSTCYGLCAAFLPGNTHVILGTREGHLLILDIASGDVVYTEENAHDGAIWSIDVRRPTPEQEGMAIMTGSADKTVKFWDVEAQEEDDEEDDYDGAGHPMVVHTRTLEMSDDVVAVRYSHSTDPTKRMVFVSTLDCTIKVFFDDTLKFFLSLYGHKLPALALDASDDDTILASSGADKTIKIWGLDFGDTHRTLHGHEDSITDLRFVKKTHNFFTTSKDGTVRYWDGDRFQQILLLHGHCAEVNCLAVSRTGAFVLSGGMDRQVRVWERTKDIVFLEEERERELEHMFDKVDSRGDEGGTANIMRKRADDNDEDMDDEDDDAVNEQPQSEAAVKRSILSVSSGDRIMEGLERADQELKDIASFRKIQGNEGKKRSPNIYLLGMEPAQYILWLLRSIKSAELEQSLLVLPLTHVERLVYYLIVLLKSGRGVEICSRVAIFMIKTHQNQILAYRSMATPLRELRRLVRMRLAESRDTVGFNLAALRAIAKVAQDRKAAYFVPKEQTANIWAGLGLGSDVAAALEKKGKRNT